MEKDGKTRVYYYHDHPYKVKEAWPHPAGWEENSWTFGKKAEFICVNVHEGDRVEVSNRLVSFFKNLVGIKVAPPQRTTGRHYWSVHIPGEDCDKWFDIDRISYVDEDYANLAKKLEQHTGKKGLTILVS